jgi:hypothetical protein
MRGIYRFLKSTIIGGLVVLVPLAVLGGILAWAIPIFLKVVVPVFEWLPDKSIGSVSLAVVVASAAWWPAALLSAWLRKRPWFAVSVPVRINSLSLCRAMP